jgi:hypothetical protein
MDVLRKIEFRRWLHRGIWACGHMVSAPAPRRGGGGGGGVVVVATDDAGGGDACGIDASMQASMQYVYAYLKAPPNTARVAAKSLPGNAR